MEIQIKGSLKDRLTTKRFFDQNSKQKKIIKNLVAKPDIKTYLYSKNKLIKSDHKKDIFIFFNSKNSQ